MNSTINPKKKKKIYIYIYITLQYKKIEYETDLDLQDERASQGQGTAHLSSQTPAQNKNSAKKKTESSLLSKENNTNIF